MDLALGFFGPCLDVGGHPTNVGRAVICEPDASHREKRKEKKVPMPEHTYLQRYQVRMYYVFADSASS